MKQEEEGRVGRGRVHVLCPTPSSLKEALAFSSSKMETKYT